MPSPKWPGVAGPLVPEVVAAALAAAGEVQASARGTRARQRVRQMLPPELADALAVPVAAMAGLLEPGGSPVGGEMPFELCPGCMSMRAPEGVRTGSRSVAARALGDGEWVVAAVRQAGSARALAGGLGLDAVRIAESCVGHDVRSESHGDEGREVLEMHARKEGMGTIARRVGWTVDRVRRFLEEEGRVGARHGHVHFEAEWWRVRLEDRGMTLRAAALEAGLKTNGADHYLRRFGLRHLVRFARGQRPPKHPELHCAVRLRELLDRHGTYEAVARELGCAPSLVSRCARQYLGEAIRWGAAPTEQFYRQQLEAGRSPGEIAAMVGRTEKTVRESIRKLGLSRLAYNTVKQRRSR
jgi:AraC-like DNA-binding protein